MASITWQPEGEFREVAVIQLGEAVYTFSPSIPEDVSEDDTPSADVVAALEAIAGTVVAPNAPAVAFSGTTGSSVYHYMAVAVTPTGDSTESATSVVTNGSTSLSSSNKVTVTKPTSLPASATGWRVVRTEYDGTAQSQDISNVLPLSTATLVDTGQTGTAYTAVVTAPPVDVVTVGHPTLA